MDFIYLDACAIIDAREKDTVEARALVWLTAARRFAFVPLTVDALDDLRRRLVS